jgi:hypothetical protein
MQRKQTAKEEFLTRVVEHLIGLVSEPIKGEKPMNAKKAIMITALGVIMSLGAMPAATQEKPSDNMQIVIEKIHADKKLLVAENMQLTEAEAKAFWPVYKQYQDELFLLRTRTVKLIKDYSDAYETMTNNTAKKLLDEYMTIEALGPKLRQAYLPKFRKVLPEVKVARYFQIENKIQAALIYELAAKIPLMKADK